MFLTGEALEFVLGVKKTSNDVSNRVIIQDRKIFYTIQITCVYRPCSVSDWLLNSRAQVTTNQRTRISVEFSQQYGLFQAQSQTSLKARKNGDGVQTGTCCLLKVV